MNYRKLRKELYSVGSNKTEADELAHLARALVAVKPKGLTVEAKKRLAPDTRVAVFRHYSRWAVAGSFAVLVLVIFIAQSALPGSWLYPVKRGTEQIRTTIQPDYQDELVEKRKEEVEQLKQESAPVEKLKQAEKLYDEALRKSEQRKHKDNQRTKYHDGSQSFDSRDKKRSRNNETQGNFWQNWSNWRRR